MTYVDIDTLLEEIHSPSYPIERGPTLEISRDTHAMKYRSRGEGFREYATRVAGALQDSQTHFGHFRELLLDMSFLPAGRIQSAIGSTRKVTPYNCFVSGVIEDNLVAGLETNRFTEQGGIMLRLCEAVHTMRMGGGVGYDFSRLRPRRDNIESMDTLASGPVSFMHIYDAACRTIASAGHRRGAQMGILRVDHPDIEEFIHEKQNNTKLTQFNISVGITDEFMRAVAEGKSFDLRFNGRTYRTIDARTLFEQIMRATWDYAEPGVIFLDTINRMNNLYYCENIFATNPCSEQPLPPYGACLLGSINLVKYLNSFRTYTNEEGNTQGYTFEWDKFVEDIPTIVRAMDNVVDVAIYPLDQQRREAKNKRRMGLGITGLANTVEALGHMYGSEGAVKFTDKLLKVFTNSIYQSSALLAKEKGSFPFYDPEWYPKSKFIKTLAPETQKIIKRYGIRNSHLTSIAPTGTISLCADNVSSGIECVFAHDYERDVLTFDGPKHYNITDYGYGKLGVVGKTAAECSVDDHLSILQTASKYMDSAVSKTVNVAGSTPWEDFKNIYFRAWESGCKGCSTFNIDGARGALLVAKPRKTENEACHIDPETGRKTCE